MNWLRLSRIPEPKVVRWQDRPTPVWKRIDGGCHRTVVARVPEPAERGEP